MQIQINSDSNISVREREELFKSQITDGLSLFQQQITRIEVHLKDANAKKSGPEDKQCTIEARVAGLDPVSVSHKASTVDDAMTGALHKMRRLLDSALGKLGRR